MELLGGDDHYHFCAGYKKYFLFHDVKCEEDTKVLAMTSMEYKRCCSGC